MTDDSFDYSIWILKSVVRASGEFVSAYGQAVPIGNVQYLAHFFPLSLAIKSRQQLLTHIVLVINLYCPA